MKWEERWGEGEGRMEGRNCEGFPDQTSSGQSICENEVVQIPGCWSQTKEDQNTFNCRWPQPPDCHRHSNNIVLKKKINCKQLKLPHLPQLASTPKPHQCQIAFNCKQPQIQDAIHLN